MPGSNAKESFDEQYAFNSTIGPLLAAVKGAPLLRLPDEQAVVADTEYHAIVNVFQQQSDWFENYFMGRSDALACEYVRIKLLERVKDNPIPIRKTAGGMESLLTRLTEFQRGETVSDEMVQIDLQKVTCFKDGERRRFVAHFNAVNVSL